MDRHAIGDGRSPRGIGAGVEVGLRSRRRSACPRASQPTLARGSRAGWRLVRRGHPSPAACRRRRTGRSSFQAATATQRLHRQIELAAEAAAAGRRHDAHRAPARRRARAPPRRGPCRASACVTWTSMRSPGAARGPARLGLDIGVLDEGRLERALGRRPRAARMPGGDVAASHAAARQHVVGLVGVHAAARRRRARASMPITRRLGCQAIGSSASRIGLDRGRVADQRQHRLAAEAHLRRRRAPAGP